MAGRVGQGICMPHVSNRVAIGVAQANQSSSFHPSVPGDGEPPVLPDQRLRGRLGMGGLPRGLAVRPPGVAIQPEGSNWVFRSWLNSNSTGQNAGGANAVCVDVAPGALLVWDSEAGTATLTSKLFDHGAGWACGAERSVRGVHERLEPPGRGGLRRQRGDWWVTLAARNEVLTRCVL